MIGLGANQAVDAIYPLSIADADGNPYVSPAEGDYMHFDPDSNRRFAQALEEKIISLL